MHILHPLVGFETSTTFASHSGYWQGSMKPASKSLLTSSFAAFSFSRAILLFFCFTSFEPSTTFNLCMMVAGSIPGMSAADHANRSAFSLMSWESSDFVFGDRVFPIFIVFYVPSTRGISSSSVSPGSSDLGGILLSESSSYRGQGSISTIPFSRRVKTDPKSLAASSMHILLFLSSSFFGVSRLGFCLRVRTTFIILQVLAIC
jgi:hypothetical protein